MLTYLALGATYGFAAAVQPGQFQAYLVSEALTNGWRRTIPVAFAPILSDIPVVTVVLLVLTQVPPLMIHALQVIGGAFVLYLAWGAFRSWRHYRPAAPAEAAPVHQTVLKAALLNLLNPNPYIAWALVLGPVLLDAWRQRPSHGVAFAGAFYAAMVAVAAGIVVAVSAAHAFGPKVARGLIGVSAIALAGFGLYQLWSGTTAVI
jgi:threonine/homoserine/homoserine lactone efflux protein